MVLWLGISLLESESCDAERRRLAGPHAAGTLLSSRRKSGNGHSQTGLLGHPESGMVLASQTECRASDTHQKPARRKHGLPTKFKPSLERWFWNQTPLPLQTHREDSGPAPAAPKSLQDGECSCGAIIRKPIACAYAKREDASVPPQSETNYRGWWRRGRVELPVQKALQPDVLQACPAV